MARATVNVDGGARGNPGPAAVGVVLRSEDGAVIESRAERIGEETNNVAEYRALLLGLKVAKANGVDAIDVVSDSELVVRQIEGRYKVKNAALRGLFTQALAALRDFEDWSIRHVRREQNADADRLVNEALDG